MTEIGARQLIVELTILLRRKRLYLTHNALFLYSIRILYNSMIDEKVSIRDMTFRLELLLRGDATIIK